MQTLKNMITKDESFYQRKQKSVDDLLCNDKITQLLAQNHLDRQFVEDHWIDFLNYEEDLKQCAHCEGIADCPKSFKGYQRVLEIIDGQIVPSLQVCRFGAKQDERRRIFSHVTSNLPKEMFLTSFTDLNLDNQGNLYLLVKQLMEDAKVLNSKGLYVHGEMGIGKTYVLTAFCNLLALNRKNCAFISMPQLLQDLKSYFNSDEDNGMTILKEVPYLILDDLGAETLSTWGRDEVLYNILNERMLRKLPTYFTSVYDFNGLKQHYLQNKSMDETIKVNRLMERIKVLANDFDLVGCKFR